MHNFKGDFSQYLLILKPQNTYLHQIVVSQPNIVLSQQWKAYSFSFYVIQNSKFPQKCSLKTRFCGPGAQICVVIIFTLQSKFILPTSPNRGMFKYIFCFKGLRYLLIISTIVVSNKYEFHITRYPDRKRPSANVYM